MTWPTLCHCSSSPHSRATRRTSRARPPARATGRIGRWNLVERNHADIEADVRAAAPPGTVAGLDITADATGLTLFATVRRADEPG